MSYCLTHCHSATGSNVCILDSISKPKDIVKRALEAGLSGVAITDHGTISAAVEMLKQRDKLRESNPDFKIMFGCEIYLIDEDNDLHRENYKTEWEYYHCILIAKDEIGWKQLRQLTSVAWERSYMFKGIRRVPVYYQDIEKLGVYGHLICQSACLGGAIPKAIMKRDADKINQLLRWFLRYFGKDFYLELQPNPHSPEQIDVNRQLLRVSQQVGIPYVITTDAHYLRKEDKSIHAAYLNSRDAKGNRETEPFYDFTYIMDEEELYEHMRESGLDDGQIAIGLENSRKIQDSVQDFDFRHSTIIPRCPLPFFVVKNTFAPFYEKYPFLARFATSEEPQDRFMLYCVENGLEAKKMAPTEEIADRLNTEFEVIAGLSDYHKQPMSAYLNLVKDIVDVVWEVSPVMPGRGSCTGFLTCYLMGITQINPLTYNLPWFRFLNLGRVDDFPDCDIDVSAKKATKIIELLRARYGQDCVLNTLTFKTETLKAAIQSVARGLGINDDEARAMSAMVPLKRGKMPSLEGCENGDPEIDTPPVPQLIKALHSYPGLYEGVEKIQGICAGIGIHASSLYIFSDGFLAQNALMRAPNGVAITAFNMHDSDDLGALKMDLLKTFPPSLFSKCMSYMLKDGVIQYQGSLRATWDKYFHPDIIDYSNRKMWENAADGKVLQLFQFGDSQVGSNTIKKVRPGSILDMALANDVMRLQGTYEGETPTDRFVRYKEHPEQAIQEMKDKGLNDAEIELLRRHLGESYFVSVEQEQLMNLLLDKDICNMPLRDVNKARKVLAKKQMEKLPDLKENFFKLGRERGNREEFLQWVWDYALLPQLAYSFSKNHSVAYSSIGAIEAWLVTVYNPLYWDCAVLSAQAGGEADDDEDVYDDDDDEEEEETEDTEGEKKKVNTTNYGKIARGIASVQRHGVKVALPDINLALMDFAPDTKSNEIIYGLQAITGANPELCDKIIANRPYKSVEDFVQKIDPTLVQMINLIKGGCFDALYAPLRRQAIMERYLDYLVKSKVTKKDKLTMANYAKCEELGLTKERFELPRRAIFFKKWEDAHEYRSDERRYVVANEASKKFLRDFFLPNLVIGKDYNTTPDGYAVKKASFTRVYESMIAPLKEWIGTNEAIDLFYEAEIEFEKQKIRDKYCEGSLSKWEMQALHYYYNDHELKNVNTAYHSISKFEELPEQPVVLGTKMGRNGTEYPVFQLTNICGTVTNADNNKHIVTILTNFGEVVDIKFYKEQYNDYNKTISQVDANGKKTVQDKSWFDRGNLLIVSGYRRENSFVPRANFEAGFKTPVQKITALNERGILSTIFSRKVR